MHRCISDILPEMLPPKNMKKNFAFRRSTSSQRQPARRLAALALFYPGLLALSSSSSHGAAATPDGSTYTTATCSYVGGVKKWVYRVDPPEVQAFRYTVTFDPSRAQLNSVAGVLFKQPFVGVVDASQGAAGILVISGSTPVGQTQPNDVDLFDIIFDDLSPLDPINNVTFTVGGGAGDFIQAYDLGLPLPPTTGAQLGPISRSATPGILVMAWDPDGAYDSGHIGGAGVWNTSNVGFDDLPLPAGLPLQGGGVTGAPADTTWINGTNLAVFGGNPGTGLVTVSPGISAAGFQFDAPGYHLSGGSLTLATPGGSIPTIEVRAGEVTVNTSIGGTQGVKKTGKGMVVLGGANTYTGTTTISAGAVQISADGNLGAAPGAPTAGVLVLDGGILRVTSAMTLNANRGVTISAANGTIDVAVGGDLSYGGVIGGSGNLAKVGAGVLTLSGSNTFAGGTTMLSGTFNNTGSLAGGVAISGGTFNNSGSLAGGAAISGGILNNIGSITGGATISGGVFNNSSPGSLSGGVTVQNGIYSGGANLSGAVVVGDGTGASDAIFHPAGFTPTTLNLASLSLNSDAVFQLTLDSGAIQADKMLVGGGTTLGSGVAQLSVQDLAFAVLPLGTFFTIIDNAPAATMSGFFSGLPDGASFVNGANTFQIDYDAGAEFNDVQLTVAPEPTSTLLLTAALALGGARRLRSRRP